MARKTSNSQVPGRKVADSRVTMTEIVLPQHTNALGTVFGGTVMSWIDIAASVCAQRHSGRICVTASIDEMHFLKGVSVGEIITVEAWVNAVHNTSCEISAQVRSENPIAGTSFQTTKALLTFVALDERGLPTSMPPLIAIGKDEKARQQQALIRRGHRKELKAKLLKEAIKI